MITAYTCVTVTCDGGCEDQGWGDGVIHFATLDEALECVRSYQWLIVGDRATCPTCTREAECAATGCQWTGWIDSELHGVPYQVRYCDHCGAMEYGQPRTELAALFEAARVVNDAAKDGA